MRWRRRRAKVERGEERKRDRRERRCRQHHVKLLRGCSHFIKPHIHNGLHILVYSIVGALDHVHLQYFIKTSYRLICRAYILVYRMFL